MANEEHLKLVQGVIDRMARNCFALKAWSVTVAAALLGFAADGSDFRFALLAMYVVVAFGFLDAYYLALEQSYRRLYEKVRTEDMSYRMTADPVLPTDILWALTSPSVWLLHGSVLLVAACVLTAV